LQDGRELVKDNERGGRPKGTELVKDNERGGRPKGRELVKDDEREVAVQKEGSW
jgi:hypothetical protein